MHYAFWRLFAELWIPPLSSTLFSTHPVIICFALGIMFACAYVLINRTQKVFLRLTLIILLCATIGVGALVSLVAFFSPMTVIYGTPLSLL